jgi:hypothetical protein
LVEGFFGGLNQGVRSASMALWCRGKGQVGNEAVCLSSRGLFLKNFSGPNQLCNLRNARNRKRIGLDRSSCLKLKAIEESVFWAPEKVVASSKWS